MEEAYKPKTFDKPRMRAVSYSEMVLFGITFVVGVLAWLLFQNILLVIFNGGTLGTFGGYSILRLAITVLMFFLYFSFIAVFLIFSTKRVALIGSVALAIVPLILFVGLTNSFIVFIVSILFYFVLISARYSMKRAYVNQIKFFLPGILRIGLALLLFYSIAMISVLHYSAIIKKSDASDIIERSVVRYSIAGLNTFMRQFNGYDPQMSFDNFIVFAGSHGLIQGESKSFDNKIFNELGGIVDREALAGEFLDKEREQIRNEFLKSLGISNKGITGITPISEVWRAYTESKALSYLDAYRSFLPAILSIGIFLTLLFLNKIFKPIIYLFTWILIYVLRIANVLTFTDEKVTIKRLKY